MFCKFAPTTILSCIRSLVLLSVTMLYLCEAHHACAGSVKDSFQPEVSGLPVLLLKDGRLTQYLGGRALDLDVWCGEFFKFDDNMFGSVRARESDTVRTFGTGFKMDARRNDVWELRAEGQLQHNAYARHSEYDGLEGHFRSSASVSFSPALSASLSAGYVSSNGTLRNARVCRQ